VRSKEEEEGEEEVEEEQGGRRRRSVKTCQRHDVVCGNLSYTPRDNLTKFITHGTRWWGYAHR